MAGVKVALLAYARFGTVALERFNGSQPEIVDYFGHVVLKRLSPQMHDFLLSCALFERFDGELCDHVLERSGSALLLEDLAARELFMLPVAEQPGCYRYHALLHDFLAKRLSLHKPLEVPRLHGRAALVFRQRGELEPALQHAQRCGEPALFQALLEEACDLWVRTAAFRRGAEVAGAAQRGAAARESASAGADDSGPDSVSALPSGALLPGRAGDAQCRSGGAGGAAAAGAGAQPGAVPARPGLRPGGPLAGAAGGGRSSDTRALHLTILAYHHLMHGRLERSIGLALEAKALLAQTGQLFLESYADLIIALCHRNAGRPTCARKEVCQDYQRTQRSSPAWVNRATAMVVALYEQNQLAAAQQLCEDLMAMVTSSSATETIATVHITLSRLLYRRQSLGLAGRLLEQLSRILQLGNYARFASQVAQESMRQAFLDGRPAALDALAQRLGIEERLATGEWQRCSPTTSAGSATGWQRSTGWWHAARSRVPVASSRYWRSRCTRAK